MIPKSQDGGYGDNVSGSAQDGVPSATSPRGRRERAKSSATSPRERRDGRTSKATSPRGRRDGVQESDLTSGTLAARQIVAYMRELAERLRKVRVCCGDWSRVCGPSVTIKHGITGVFLDPPYADEADAHG